MNGYHGPERRRYMRRVRDPLPWFALTFGLLAADLAAMLARMAGR